MKSLLLSGLEFSDEQLFKGIKLFCSLLSPDTLKIYEIHDDMTELLEQDGLENNENENDIENSANLELDNYGYDRDKSDDAYDSDESDDD